jgi:hypothetical protein
VGKYTPIILQREPKESIFQYRLRIAKSLDFEWKEAELLAAANNLSLVDVAVLLDKGCPHNLVIPILL